MYVLCVQAPVAEHFSTRGGLGDVNVRECASIYTLKLGTFRGWGVRRGNVEIAIEIRDTVRDVRDYESRNSSNFWSSRECLAKGAQLPR